MKFSERRTKAAEGDHKRRFGSPQEWIVKQNEPMVWLHINIKNTLHRLMRQPTKARKSQGLTWPLEISNIDAAFQLAFYPAMLLLIRDPVAI